MTSYLKYRKRPIFVKSIKDFEKNYEPYYNNNQMFYSYCEVCKENLVYKNRNSIRVRRKFVCLSCCDKRVSKTRVKNLKTFFSKMTDKEKRQYYRKIKRKRDKTNLKRYGRTNVGQFGSKEHTKAIKQYIQDFQKTLIGGIWKNFLFKNIFIILIYIYLTINVKKENQE